jgi:hypothetical protein
VVRKLRGAEVFCFDVVWTLKGGAQGKRSVRVLYIGRQERQVLQV